MTDEIMFITFNDVGLIFFSVFVWLGAVSSGVPANFSQLTPPAPSAAAEDIFFYLVRDGFVIHQVIDTAATIAATRR